MKTIFTKIIDGEIPSYKVAEDNNCFASTIISFTDLEYSGPRV